METKEKGYDIFVEDLLSGFSDFINDHTDELAELVNDIHKKPASASYRR